MDLELHSLRVFREVMSAGSFTAAGKALRLTQPAVSQHIARLEERLGGRLFQRVGRSIVPTETGTKLLSLVQRLDLAFEEFGQGIQKDRAELTGRVRYAMPESCQWTPHYRKIMAQIAEFPMIRFEIGIETQDQIVHGVMEGRLDFGFVLGERLQPELRFEKFSDEAYVATAADEAMFAAIEKGTARWVSYPGWERFFDVWSRAHRLSRKAVSQAIPAVRVGTLAGAIHAVQEGAGIGVFPSQCVLLETKRRPLVVWSEDRSSPASQPVYLIRRGGENPPRRVQWVIERLRSAKREE